MKKLILILAIFSACKKKENAPAQQTQSNPDRTVTVHVKANAGAGKVYIDWYGDDEPMNDSTYNYSNNYFTKVVSGNKIYLQYSAQICGSCQLEKNEVTVHVDGILVWSKTEDVGAVKYTVNF